MGVWLLVSLVAGAQEVPVDPHRARWQACLRTLVAREDTVRRGQALAQRPVLDATELDELHTLAAEAPSCAAAHALVARHSWGLERLQASTLAQSLAPDDADLMVELSAALWAVGRKDEARSWLERAGADIPAEDLPRANAGGAGVPDVGVVQGERPALAPIPFDPTVSEEIVVYGTTADEEREALEGELEELGYGRGKRRRDGSTTFAPVNAQRPGVTIHADGTFDVQSSGLVPTARVPGSPQLGTVPRIVSRRKLLAGRAEVVDAVEERLRSWRAAVSRERYDASIGPRVHVELRRIWFDGTGRDGQPLPDAAARRGALLDYWSSRACNEAGETVRVLVNRFLVDVVQPSATPLQPDEVRRAEAAQGCGVSLELPVD